MNQLVYFQFEGIWHFRYVAITLSDQILQVYYEYRKELMHKI